MRIQISNATLGEQVAHELRLRIFHGALPGGELLIEGKLSAEFGVSRGPIRDALAELREDGLAVPHGRSLRVVEVDGDLITELYELRAALETYSIERALRRGADLSNAQRALAAMDDASERGDSPAFNDADLAFHGTFFAAGGPMVQAHFWRVFHRGLQAVLDVNPHPGGDLHRAVIAHRRLFAEIESQGNWRALFTAHMEEALARVRA